jgi:PIN domain nuclease of toxin-antitoxin system
MQYIVDTHALIWFLEGNARLGNHAKAVLADPQSTLILPATALAESVWIVSRGRTTIPSVEELLSAIDRDTRIEIYPLDRTVVEKTIQLLAVNEMHDRQIVATALVIQLQGKDVALLTCDQNITAANLLPIIW